MKLPTFVFLFDPHSTDDERVHFSAELARRSSHMTFNITDPIQDSAAGLSLRWQDMEEALRVKWPDLLGRAFLDMIDVGNCGHEPAPVIFTHCSHLEDVHAFTTMYSERECLVINFGPIWKLPPRCRTITIPVEGVEERIAYLQNELNNLERAIEHKDETLTAPNWRTGRTKSGDMM